MGFKSVSIYLLDLFSERELFIVSAEGIEGLSVSDSNISSADLLFQGFDEPSIFVSTYDGLAKIFETTSLSSLTAKGHHFIIITERNNDINLEILETPESFNFIQPPLDKWKLRPLLISALKKISGTDVKNPHFRDIDHQTMASMFIGIYDHITDPILWVDGDTLMIINHNEAARHVFGLGQSMQGDSLLQYSHQPEKTSSALKRRVTYSADRILKNRLGGLIKASVHTAYYDAPIYRGALIIIKDLTPDINLKSEIEKRDKIFQNVLDNIATPILQISADDYRILSVNDITSEKLGYSKEQMLNSTIESFCIGGGDIHRILERKKSFFTEWKVIDAWNEIRLMEIRAQFILDDEHSRFVINLQDITERQALLENQEFNLRRLREAHRMAKVGSWIFNKGDSFPYFSPELLELHDINPEIPMDREEYLDMIQWDSRAEIENWMREMLSGAKSYPIRYSIRTNSGKIRFFLLHCEQILNNDGEIIGLTGTSQDISEVEFLEQKNSLYTQTFDSMDTEMILLSEGGLVIEYNQAAAKKLGYPKEYLKGKFVSVLNSRYTQESWSRFWERVSNKGGELREARHRRRDGTEYDALISISLLDYMGEKMVLALINDISEIKTYQKQLQKNLEEKTALLQEVHHRMGNNLQTIASFISLKSMSSEDSQIRLQLEEVNDRIMGIAAIHNSMYAQERFLDLDLLEHLQTVWKKTRVQAEFGPDTIIHGDHIMIDINRALPLSLVVNELFSNSFRHAFNVPGGVIELHLQNQEDVIRIHYHDTGVGYPESNDMENKDTVGLTLIRNLVERQLKGSIRFYNDGGANAEIILPKEFFNRSISDPLHSGRTLI